MSRTTEKTERAIEEAFMELRRKRPLDKITIAELTEKAQVNKATFYRHYRDIYDLSDRLLLRRIDRMFDDLPADTDLSSPEKLLLVVRAFLEDEEIYGVLMTKEQIIAGMRLIHRHLMEMYIKAHPAAAEDRDEQVRFSFLFFGIFFSYYTYRDGDRNALFADLSDMVQTLTAR